MALLPDLMPSMADMPMSLGDHLHELRRRLVWPIITFLAAFIAAFAFQVELKRLMLWPLQRGLRIVGTEVAKSVGFNLEAGDRMLYVLELSESTTTAVRISMIAAAVIALPVLLFHLWRFISVGLKFKERRLGFLFIPAGVLFFYLGLIGGYFLGLPYFYAFLIEFMAIDTTAIYQLRQSEYVDTFTVWTLACGLIMDIPWLVVVLVRVGLLTPAKIAENRKLIVIGNLILAAIITPTADLASLMAMFIPMQLLFEIGLVVSRMILGSSPRKAVLGGDHEPDDGDPV